MIKLEEDLSCMTDSLYKKTMIYPVSTIFKLSGTIYKFLSITRELFLDVF